MRYYRNADQCTRDRNDWVYFDYNRLAREITLYNHLGNGYHTYPCAPYELDEWLVMAHRTGRLVSDPDIILDDGL